MVSANNMTKEDKWLVKELRAHLKKRGLSQRGLAREIGINHATLSYWLSGRQQPMFWSAVKVANAIKLDLRDVQRAA